MSKMLIHTLEFNPGNWMSLLQELNQRDRFDMAWQAIDRGLPPIKNTPITLRGLRQLRNLPGLKTLLFSGESPE